MSNEPDKPVLDYAKPEPRWPWYRVLKYLAWPTFIAMVVLVFIMVVPAEERRSRYCAVCGRIEHRRLQFGIQTGPVNVQSGPLEAWIASREAPCSHNWGHGWATVGWRTYLGERWVNRVPVACNVSTVMGIYQVDDQAIAEALRMLRAKDMGDETKENAVKEMVVEWVTRCPPRAAPLTLTATTAPVQPL